MKQLQIKFEKTHRNFNPTLVQLEYYQKLVDVIAFITFQSHIGAIRIFCILIITFFFTGYFNPTLVQLELLVAVERVWNSFGFQSHIGAIRMLRFAYSALPCYIEFQSHIGAIRIQYSQTVKDLQLVFQSHIGAIRISAVRASEARGEAFQSHIGAIRIRLT